MAGPTPLDPDGFRALMRPLGPFEDTPHIAVALSGGPDSMALTLLLNDWVGRHGGRLNALTVDHGLRPGSAAEAERVARWMAARGIAHRTLRWDGPKPPTGIQEAARAARYGLLQDWCREHGILHLALGHQREDQAETLLIRMESASGPDGLAGMADRRELADCRLIRPLLDVPRAVLEATCRAAGQDFVDDPSNRDPRYARIRLRGGLTPDRVRALAEEARGHGLARAVAEADLARIAARAVTFHPERWAELDPGILAAVDREQALRLLTRLIIAVGARNYPPRREPVGSLLDRVGEGLFAGCSIGGCVIERGRDRLRIVREARGLQPDIPVASNGTAVWDNRFRLHWRGPGPAVIGPLTQEGWRNVAADLRRTARSLPASVRRTLPAIRTADGGLIIPHLSCVTPDSHPVGYELSMVGSSAAIGTLFSVVMPAGGII